MAEQIIESEVWGTRKFAENANNWSLASDLNLLKHLEAFSDSLLENATETNDKLNNLLDSLDETSLNLDLARNELSSLSNTQFIESRIYEDDEITSGPENIEIKKTEIRTEEDNKKELRKAVLRGLEVIDKYYDKVEVPESDSEDEIDFPSFVLRAKDPYINRPLPHVIGTTEWYKSIHVGLGDSSSDSETENQSEKFSDSNSEADIHVQNKSGESLSGSVSSEGDFASRLEKPVANSTFNDTTGRKDFLENDFEYNSVPVHAPISQNNFAEQLAQKLGDIIKENIKSAPVNKKPIQKPPQNYGIVFSEEPPSLDDDDMFSTNQKSHGIFSGGDGLFDDLESEVPFWGAEPTPKKSESVENKPIPNVFESRANENEAVSTKSKSLSQQEIRNEFRNELDRKFKKPTDLFKNEALGEGFFSEKVEKSSIGKNQNSSPLGSSSVSLIAEASRREKTKPSLFDDSDSSDDMFTPLNPKLRVQAGKITSLRKQDVQTESIKAPVGGVHVIANSNLFAKKELSKFLKSRKQYSNSNSDSEDAAVNDGSKKKQVETLKKEDIKTDDVVKMNQGERKKVSVFDDDDDDLFKSSGTLKKQYSSNLFDDEEISPKQKSPHSTVGDSPREENILKNEVLSKKAKDSDDKIHEETISKSNIFDDHIFNETFLKQENTKTKPKKVLSLFSDEEDSDDIFSWNNTKTKISSSNKETPRESLLITKDTHTIFDEKSSRNVETCSKTQETSLFDDDDDLFSANISLKKDPQKKPSRNNLFDDIEDQDELFMSANASKEEMIKKTNSILEGDELFAKPESNVGEDKVKDNLNKAIPDNISKKEEETQTRNKTLPILTEEESFVKINATEVNKEGRSEKTRGVKDVTQKLKKLPSESNDFTLKQNVLNEEILKSSQDKNHLKPEEQLNVNITVADEENATKTQEEIKNDFEENEETPTRKHTSLSDSTILEESQAFEEVHQIEPSLTTKGADSSPLEYTFVHNEVAQNFLEDLPENQQGVKSVSSQLEEERRSLFDSTPPPDFENWDTKSENNFEDDVYPLDNSENTSRGQRSSIFDREPPSLFCNESSGIVRDPTNRLDTDISSFYPYASSSRRFSADTFADEVTDDSLFSKRRPHQLIPEETPEDVFEKKGNTDASIFEITPSGKFSELYSEASEPSKPRKSVTFEDIRSDVDVPSSVVDVEHSVHVKVEVEKVGKDEERSTKIEETSKTNEEEHSYKKDLKGADENVNKNSNGLEIEKVQSPFEVERVKFRSVLKKKPTLREKISPEKEGEYFGTGDDQTVDEEVIQRAAPGKLKHNLNIDVRALLPGGAPPRRSLPPRPASIAVSSDVSVEDFMPAESLQRPRVVPVISVPGSEQHVEVLRSVTKDRAKLPKRKPSTKKGREAFRKSCTDLIIPLPDEVEEIERVKVEDNHYEVNKSSRVNFQRDLAAMQLKLPRISSKRSQEIDRSVLKDFSSPDGQKSLENLVSDFDVPEVKLETEEIFNAITSTGNTQIETKISENLKDNVDIENLESCSVEDTFLELFDNDDNAPEANIFDDINRSIEDVSKSTRQVTLESLVGVSKIDSEEKPTMTLDLAKSREANRQSFLETDDFASPEFNKPGLFDNDNDDDLFSEKKLPPRSKLLKTSLFADYEDDDDFLQNVTGATGGKSNVTKNAESQNSNGVAPRKPKSSILKKLDNIEVTSDPLNALDR